MTNDTFTIRRHTHKFDWEEARRLRQEGWTYRAIGEHLGVTHTSVRKACHPEVADPLANRPSGNGVCEDCGAPCTKTRGTRPERHVCRQCGQKRDRAAWLAERTNAAGEIKCRVCGKFKSPDAFRLAAVMSHKFRCRQCDYETNWGHTDPSRRHRRVNHPTTGSDRVATLIAREIAVTTRQLEEAQQKVASLQADLQQLQDSAHVLRNSGSPNGSA